jgi:hypothetical protein
LSNCDKKSILLKCRIATYNTKEAKYLREFGIFLKNLDGFYRGESQYELDDSIFSIGIGIDVKHKNWNWNFHGKHELELKRKT